MLLCALLDIGYWLWIHGNGIVGKKIGEGVSWVIKVTHGSSKKVAATRNKPQFEFYSIFPRNNKSEINAESYELLVAIVDDFAEADALKARLILSGFNVNIAPRYQGGVRKYQVSVGPYVDLQKATAKQKQLKVAGISSKLKKCN